MEENFIRERLTQLRMKKNVSEYKMSLDLGHSKSYIQSIVSGRAMPSMTEFLYICDYLDVTPAEFFDEKIKNPALLNNMIEKASEMGDDDLQLLCRIIIPGRSNQCHGISAVLYLNNRYRLRNFYRILYHNDRCSFFCYLCCIRMSV